MSLPVLTYFDGRGRAEGIRIALCAAGVEYKEEFLTTKEQFWKLCDSGALCFSQVPLLEIDGEKFVQCKAILGYIGRKYQLYGKNNIEASKIDMLAEGARDFYQPFLPMLFTPAPEEETIAGIKKNQFPKYMGIFEKQLSGGEQYLVGGSFSLADVGLLEVLLSVEDYMGLGALDEYPRIKEYYQTMKKLPTIQTYLSKYRKPKNTPEYVSTVITTLAK